MNNGYGMNAGMGWGWLFGLIAIAGIVLLVILVVRLVGAGVSHAPSAPLAPRVDEPAPAALAQARRILAERYARGEIDTAEYHERLEHLQDE